MARTKVAEVPEVGNEAPEFHLPSAQGGQLRLGMRTARGPVVVVFYSGISVEEDVEYFKALAGKEDEINMAAGSVVGVGVAEPDVAREFVEASGMKSYVLYDYARVASREWGLLQKDKEHGEHARPAVFIVDTDRKVAHAWVDERPDPAEILAKVSEITGLPKPPEEEGEEKPKKPAKAKAKPEGAADSTAASETGEKPKREKPSSEKSSPEEREKRQAEQKPTREAAGATSETKDPKAENSESEKPGNNKEPQSVNGEPEADGSAETEEEKAQD